MVENGVNTDAMTAFSMIVSMIKHAACGLPDC